EMKYFFSSKRRHTKFSRDWSSDVCSYDLDIYHEEYLIDLGLNEKQIEALLFFKTTRVITNSEYQTKFEISERTARYDLANLVERKLLLKSGDKKSTKYEYL